MCGSVLTEESTAALPTQSELGCILISIFSPYIMIQFLICTFLDIGVDMGTQVCIYFYKQCVCYPCSDNGRKQIIAQSCTKLTVAALDFIQLWVHYFSQQKIPWMEPFSRHVWMFDISSYNVLLLFCIHNISCYRIPVFPWESIMICNIRLIWFNF